MAYQPPKLETDLETPRLRNLALYAMTFASEKGLEALGIPTLISSGAALAFYGLLFFFMNPDLFLFTNSGSLEQKIDKKDIIIKPIVQPFKDFINIFRMRRVRL